jgi:hypothetical protein
MIETKKKPTSGKEIERRFLTWLRHYYESLILARPDDNVLSRKLDCVIFLMETSRTRYEKENNFSQGSTGLHENGI